MERSYKIRLEEKGNEVEYNIRKNTILCHGANKGQLLLKTWLRCQTSALYKTINLLEGKKNTGGSSSNIYLCPSYLRYLFSIYPELFHHSMDSCMIFNSWDKAEICYRIFMLQSVDWKVRVQIDIWIWCLVPLVIFN